MLDNCNNGNTNFVLVSDNNLTLYWQTIAEQLRANEHVWADRYELGDIYNEIANGLLYGIVAPELPFVFLFCLVDYPLKRIARITFAAGTPAVERKNLLETLHALARNAGAVEVEAVTDPVIALWLQKHFGYVYERVYVVGKINVTEN